MYLTNDSGYYLDMSTYKEVVDERTGEVIYSSSYGAISAQFIIWRYLCEGSDKSLVLKVKFKSNYKILLMGF